LPANTPIALLPRALRTTIRQRRAHAGSPAGRAETRLDPVRTASEGR